MTQPAVHGQHGQQQDQRLSRQDTPREEQPATAPGQPGPERNRRATQWRTAALIAAAGVPVGLLWWLLAPSGLNLLSGNPALRNGSNTEAWLPRDLVLAGLFLLAGCIAGALAAGSKHQESSGRDVVLAVLGGAVGAVLAWRTGVLCGIWFGTPEDASANASIAFSLRSYALLAIWPAAVALSIFVGTAFSTPRRAGPDPDGATDAAPDAAREQPPA